MNNPTYSELKEMETKELLAIANGICWACKMGEISYEEARERVEPYLIVFNEKGREIASKYRRRFFGVSFSKLMR